MQDQATAITTTAACETYRHSSCRKVVFSLTDAHLTDCQCPCHEPAPVDPDQELEDLLDREADAHLWDWSL